jgi:hypothetical protein
MASSSDSHRRAYTARISNQEWENWKDEIRIEYLSDKTVDEVVKTLRDRGLNVTYVMFEHLKMSTMLTYLQKTSTPTQGKAMATA